jgi:23S rRNA (uracil1939-C5)-methyltransferase
MIFEGEVIDSEFPGKSIVRVIPGPDDKFQEFTAKVKGGIEGQRVNFKIRKRGAGRRTGTFLSVAERSPLESEIISCPNYGNCGGCLFLTVPEEKELEMKQKWTRKLFTDLITADKNGGKSFDDIYEGIIASPDTSGYRNKMEYSFGDEYKGGPLTLGLHKKHGMYDVLDCDACELVDNDMNTVTKIVHDYAVEKGIPFYNKADHVGILRFLLVRRSHTTGDMLVALVTSSQRLLNEELLKNFGVGTADIKDLPYSKKLELAGKLTGNPDAGSRETEYLERGFIPPVIENTGGMDKENVTHVYTEAKWITDEPDPYEDLKDRLLDAEKSGEIGGRIAGFFHVYCDTYADAVRPDHVRKLYGDDYIYEELCGLKFRLSLFSFFQTNTSGAERLYGKALEYVSDEASGNTVFDLYSGTGTIAQIMAKKAASVIGVEIVPDAVEAARQNAELNGLTNCKFIADDVLTALDNIAEKPDFIMLDPPREGINPKAMKKIMEYGVENIVYISCKPTSLAHDLEVMMEHGYKALRMCSVDMFPNTPNVETVILLSQQKTG